MSVCCEKFLFAIVMAYSQSKQVAWLIYMEHTLCLLRRATSEPSALHTTYFTGGVVISARVFCCWMSYSTTDDAELRIRLAVPP